MQSREATLTALNEGKELTSTITEIKYKLFNGQLYSKYFDRADWMLSGLMFYNPVSWLNLQE